VCGPDAVYLVVCAAVHAHVVLWVHPDDVERAARGITACVPGVFHQDSKTWKSAKGANAVDEDLLQLVLGFQMHVCRDFLCMKNKRGKCSKHFPFPEQHERDPKEDHSMGGMWTYFRPGHEHRNVVPYHAGVLLTWRAHMNLQRVTHADWTRYLLK
jgi:hypothetical protein